MAHELVVSLRAVGVESRVEGRGVRWSVKAERGQRGLRIDCSWYGPVETWKFTPPDTYPGPEYLVVLHENDDVVKEGRTRGNADGAIAAADDWLGGASVDAVCERSPYIDEGPRAMRRLIESIGKRYWQMRGTTPPILWVFGQRAGHPAPEGRHCKVVYRDGRCTCWLVLGEMTVASIGDLDDLEAVAAVWLDELPTLDELPLLLPNVQVLQDAVQFLRDPALWHWTRFRWRMDKEDHVLTPLAPFIDMLAKSEVATRFFTYTSHDWLCFSSSSHYPWVDTGAPRIGPADEPGCVCLEREVVPYDEALGRVEAALLAAPHAPFPGTAVMVEQKAILAALEDQGSALRTQVIPSFEYRSVMVRKRPRSCVFQSARCMKMYTADRWLATAWADVRAAVEAVIRFLDDDEPLESFVDASGDGIKPR